jgi:hypothetical protein
VIVTHTQNADGQRRIYLGGKSSIEIWLEPKADGHGWSFRWEPAVTGQQLDAEQAHQAAIHLLRQLADELNVAPADLATVPWDSIAALHMTDPFSRRRVSLGRRRTIEQGFMAVAPELKRAQHDFTAHDNRTSMRQRA